MICHDFIMKFPWPTDTHGICLIFPGEVHQIRDLPGHVAWRKFLDLIGFDGVDMDQLQVLLRKGYDRAKQQGYKQGGRKDHA